MEEALCVLRITYILPYRDNKNTKFQAKDLQSKILLENKSILRYYSVSIIREEKNTTRKYESIFTESLPIFIIEIFHTLSFTTDMELLFMHNMHSM